MNITRIPGAARGRCTVEHNGLVWTGATAQGAPVAEQTRAALEHIEAGAGKLHIVEALVCLTPCDLRVGRFQGPPIQAAYLGLGDADPDHNQQDDRRAGRYRQG